jgi:tRNA nucleotidyltransferase (CCA-adding enzyme)
MARFNELAGRGALERASPQAVWPLIEQAMADEAPWRFVEVLRDCGALEHLLPELDLLFGVPQPALRHPEICAGMHSLLALRRAAERTADPAIRFAALVHDIGKAATPREAWPHHVEHHRTGVRAIERMAARLQMPARLRELAVLAVRHHTAAQHAVALRPGEREALVAGVATADRLEAMFLICEADHRGRAGFERAAFDGGAALRAAFRWH